MQEKIFTIHRTDLTKIIASRPFLALPQEEIDRFFAAIEVFSIEHDQAEADSALVQLTAYVAIHFNYSWFSFQNEKSMSSLGFEGHFRQTDGNGLFLDESYSAGAARILNEHTAINVGYTLRLSGLLLDSSTDFGRAHLGMVYIARLRQPGPDTVRLKHGTNSQFLGIGELQENRDRYDSWSRILIENMAAL